MPIFILPEFVCFIRGITDLFLPQIISQQSFVLMLGIRFAVPASNHFLGGRDVKIDL